jgi:hypothetical protein
MITNHRVSATPKHFHRVSVSPARIGAQFIMRFSRTRKALALLEARNIKREDFDADKNRGMTLGEWLDSYLINLSDDQIRRAFNECSRHVPKEIRPPKPLIVKRMVRGAGFENTDSQNPENSEVDEVADLSKQSSSSKK